MPADPQAREIQRRYYTETASEYETLHVAEGDEHFRALELMSAHLTSHACRSVLDVGTGTGRALAWLRANRPDLDLHGVEPVEALIQRAIEDNDVPREMITVGSGEQLPFDDGSFDAVCEFGVLHHVPQPELVVREMTRVARRAVFLSDDNRFGFGRYPLRVLKLLLARAGLWKLADRARTRGRGYRITDHDGLAYSYSVYDTLPVLEEWADTVVVLPTMQDRPGKSPLLTSSRVLACALRDE